MTVVSLVILFLVLVRCLVPVTANPYWETDPRLLAGELKGAAPSLMVFGPAAVAWLDALSLLAAAAAMGLHVVAGGAVRWGSVALAAVGGVFAAMHMPQHSDNMFLGGGWIGAVSLALAVSHLGQWPAARRWFAAALVAMATPMAIAAARWVFLDQPATRLNFLQHEDEFLAARQWERGSPEHLMFVRRMDTPEAIGAFSFSNVLGSVAAATAALACVWTWGLAAARQHRRATLPAALALAALATLAMTRSKGAAVAAAMVAGLLVAAILLRRKAKVMRWLPHAGIATIVLAVAVVLLRGAAGPPPTAEGERSLLFRVHYWQAAARIVTSSPGHSLVGCGPAAFQDEYASAKNPLNPEEIRSTHNVAIDLITMLGLGGWAWAALLGVWFWQAARGAAESLWASAGRFGSPPSQGGAGGGSALTDELITNNGGASASIQARPSPNPSLEGRGVKAAAPADESEATGGASIRQSLTVATPDLIAALVLTTLLFGAEITVRWAHIYDQATFLMWAGGAMAFLGSLSILVTRGWWSTAATQLGFFAAAAVLLVHNQIEMTFHQASSSPWAWLVIGLAAATPALTDEATPAGATRIPPRGRWWPRLSPAIGLLLLAFIFMAAIAAPLTSQQSKLREASEVLQRDPRSSMALERAIDLLAAAERIVPGDPRPAEWQARLAMQLAASLQRQLRQMEAAPPQAKAQVRDLLRHHVLLALAAFDRQKERGNLSHSARRQYAQVLEYTADLMSDPQHLNHALEQWHLLAAERPFVWQDQRDLGHLLWRMDRRDDAVQHYRKAIELSDLQYLDPLRQIGTKERTLLESRLPG